MSPQLQGTPQDEQAIRTTATEFVTAWNRNDVRALASCFANDGDLVNPEGRAGRGRSAVEKLLNEEQNGQFKGSRLNMQQQHLRFLKTRPRHCRAMNSRLRVCVARMEETSRKRSHITSVLRKE